MSGYFVPNDSASLVYLSALTNHVQNISYHFCIDEFLSQSATHTFIRSNRYRKKVYWLALALYEKSDDNQMCQHPNKLQYILG